MHIYVFKTENDVWSDAIQSKLFMELSSFFMDLHRIQQRQKRKRKQMKTKEKTRGKRRKEEEDDDNNNEKCRQSYNDITALHSVFNAQKSVHIA